MPLTKFDTSLRVIPSAAKHDNVQFSMPLGIFRDVQVGPDSVQRGIDVQEVAEYLGAPPESLRGQEHRNIAEFYSAFFTRPTGRWGHRELYLRSDPIPSLSHDARFNTNPLCAGILNLETVGIGANRYVTADYCANLNPTRFVRYQNPNILRAEWASILVPDLFGTLDLPYGDEFSLDGQDNWIVDRPGAIWQAFLGNWTQRLTDYFTTVEAAMRSEMNRRGELSSLDGTGTLSFSHSTEPWRLRRVETYWEFAHDTEPEMLEIIDRGMRSFCALPYVRNSFEGSGETITTSRERSTPNTVALTATVAPGTKLVVYAKTNRRLRFEVRHTIRDLRPASELRRTCRQAHGVPGLLSVLEVLSADAAEVVNAFLNHLERMLSDSVVPWRAAATDFLFKVAQRCPNPAVAQVIVNLLLTEGAVSRTEALNGSIDALRGAGVLERVANRQGQQSATFAPTPAYRDAVAYLAEIADVSHLTVARRQRR